MSETTEYRAVGWDADLRPEQVPDRGMWHRKQGDAYRDGAKMLKVDPPFDEVRIEQRTVSETVAYVGRMEAASVSEHLTRSVAFDCVAKCATPVTVRRGEASWTGYVIGVVDEPSVLLEVDGKRVVVAINGSTVDRPA